MKVSIVGSGTVATDEVRATLERMLDESGAHELMIQDLIAEPSVRRRSRELVADMFAA